MMGTINVLHVLLCVLNLASGLIMATGELSPIGICYDTAGHHLPPPGEVVSMYLSHGIGRMRLYEPNEMVFESLRGSGIEVMVGVKNHRIKRLTDPHTAKEWIDRYIRPYKQDVRFRYIAVGNEAIPKSESDHVLPAIKNLHAILTDDHSLHHIKVSTVISETALAYPPSTATFSGEALEFMIPIARHLNKHGTPLLLNLNPYYTYKKERGQFKTRLEAGTLFQAAIDVFKEALEKVGKSEVSVVVSEIGWPLESHSVRSESSDERATAFLSYVIKRAIASREEDIYLYTMFDKNDQFPFSAEESWGLFSKRGNRLVLNISFT